MYFPMLETYPALHIFNYFPLAIGNRAHQGFGWVGEWANTGLVNTSPFLRFCFLILYLYDGCMCRDRNELSKKATTQSNLIRLQTLYHADKQKIDQYILELVTWLHRLISVVRQRDNGLRPLSHRSPTRGGLFFHSKMKRLPSLDYVNKTHGVQFSQEDINLLGEVCWRRLVPGKSKSQEFSMSQKEGSEVLVKSKSAGCSPNRDSNATQDLECRRSIALDEMDGH